ncbi:MAG: hypothetical protein HY306_09720 [Nitrosomonadales bacterium]|nr:hypothetical protein [Nitrosomonadales bacterium]
MMASDATDAQTVLPDCTGNHSKRCVNILGILWLGDEPDIEITFVSPNCLTGKLCIASSYCCAFA